MCSYLLCKYKANKMTPEQEVATFAFARLSELLRKREVPGAERREAELQAEFKARYCDTETEYCSTKTDEDSEEEF